MNRKLKEKRRWRRRRGRISSFVPGGFLSPNISQYLHHRFDCGWRVAAFVPLLFLFLCLFFSLIKAGAGAAVAAPPQSQLKQMTASYFTASFNPNIDPRNDSILGRTTTLTRLQTAALEFAVVSISILNWDRYLIVSIPTQSVHFNESFRLSSILL